MHYRSQSLIGQNIQKPRFSAECLFLDVAQGTCNIVLLGNSRAIVIDCGPKGIMPVHALKYFGVSEIVALIVSHNDSDHYGGAAQIIQSFPKQIHQIYFLEDRLTRRTQLLTNIRHELKTGNLLSQPIRLEADSQKGKIIFTDPERAINLQVLFPWMLANIDAREAGGKNRTSAVLALNCGAHRIVFGGDLDYEGWRQVHNEWGKPIVCDALAVSHHGGALTNSNEQQRLAWIYRNAIRCDTAIVSVGSVNQFNHPRPAHIRALKQSGANVLCTQITTQCCENLEPIRPGVIQPALPGKSTPHESLTVGAGRSRDVACAGSVAIELGPGAINVRRLADHQAAVDHMATSEDGQPLCRLN